MESHGGPLLTGVIVEEEIEVTVDDLCLACDVQVERIVELVEEGVLEPVAGCTREPRFSGASLRRAAIATRLQRDLGVNAAGAALVLELLEEVAALRMRLRRIGGD